MDNIFLQEGKNISKLIKLGYSQMIIDKYRQSKCIGCGNIRKYCQCPFSGSAHPTRDERFELVRRELEELIKETLKNT